MYTGPLWSAIAGTACSISSASQGSTMAKPGMPRIIAISSVAWWLGRSEEHTSELQSLMRISYAVFCLKKKKTHEHKTAQTHQHDDNTVMNYIYLCASEVYV